MYAKVFWRRVVSTAMLIVMSVILCSMVYAKDDEYTHFLQGDSRWGGYVYGGGCTLAAYGCAITGISMLMAYANEDLQDVNTWNPKVAAQKFSFAGGAIYWGSTTNADPTFSIVGGGKQYEGGNLSAEESRKRVVDLVNKGYYVLICTTGLYNALTHYSPIIGLDGDTPIVWDVAGGGKAWSEWAGHGLTEIIAYQSTKRKSTDAYKNKGGSSSKKKPTSGNVSGNREKDAADTVKLLTEWELLGMPEKGDILGNQKAIYPGDYQELSVKEKTAVTSIKDTMSGSRVSIPEWFGRVIEGLGIGCLVYSLLLFLALIFDYSNVFIEFSLLKMLTLGRYRLVTSDYYEKGIRLGFEESHRVTNVTPKMCMIRVFILVLVGIALTSGVLQYVIVLGLNKIRGIS